MLYRAHPDVNIIKGEGGWTWMWCWVRREDRRGDKRGKTEHQREEKRKTTKERGDMRERERREGGNREIWVRLKKMESFGELNVWCGFDFSCQSSVIPGNQSCMSWCSSLYRSPFGCLSLLFLHHSLIFSLISCSCSPSLFFPTKFLYPPFNLFLTTSSFLILASFPILISSGLPSIWPPLPFSTYFFFFSSRPFFPSFLCFPFLLSFLSRVFYFFPPKFIKTG